MSTVLLFLSWLCQIYLYLLIARVVVDWIQVFARDWRPRGVVAAVLEILYSVTDPPVRAVRKVVPPLRLGSVALDVAFILVFIAVSLLSQLLLQAAYAV